MRKGSRQAVWRMAQCIGIMLKKALMYVLVQNFLIDAMYLLAAVLWWKSATTAPQSEKESNETLWQAYRHLDTAIELIYSCFDARILSSKSPFNPHVSGPALYNASAAFCTAIAVFLQFTRDLMSACCEDQGLIAAVMLAFLVVIFLFPFFKYFFRRWKKDIIKSLDEEKEKSE